MREMTEARPEAAAAAPPLAMRILRALAESREITLLLLVILLALAGAAFWLPDTDIVEALVRGVG